MAENASVDAKTKHQQKNEHTRNNMDNNCILTK